MALRKNWEESRWIPRNAKVIPRSKFIPVTPRNKSVNLVEATENLPTPPSISMANDEFRLNWDVFNRQMMNSAYGTFNYGDYIIQPKTYYGMNIDGTPYVPPIKYRLNKDVIRNQYPQFTWGYTDQLKLIPTEFAQWKTRTKDKVIMFKGNFKDKVRYKYNNYRMRWYIHKNKDLIKIATTGPVEYDYLKTIKVPTVICYNYKENNSPDKTRVLYPDGFCYVHYRGSLDTCLDWEAGFSRSCFSEGSKSLETTVEGMKRNDGISKDYQKYIITKTYPYLGPDNKHHMEKYR